MMTKSPNDQDPPDHVTGNTPLEEYLEKVYEKFPQLLDWETVEDVDEVLKWVINEAYGEGQKDAAADAGEYIAHIEREALGAVRMVLAASTEKDHVFCSDIDWEWLRKVDKQFGRKNEGQT